MKNFSAEPWMVVEASCDSHSPAFSKFKTKALAIEYAGRRADSGRCVFHVFEVTRVASVHPQSAKVYEE